MLKVSQLSFFYDQVKILNDISFELRDGHLLHLKGPNGVGKSTLLAILAGLLQARSGEVTWNGQERGLINPPLFAYLGAEANGLYLAMNAFQNLRFWSSLAAAEDGVPVSNSVCEATLSGWGLDKPYLQHGLAVEFFSTGMRRRLALARLTLTPARCWLLDEPIYGLDAKGIGLFRQALQDHCKRGGSAIIVSHDHASLAGLPLTEMELQPA